MIGRLHGELLPAIEAVMTERIAEVLSMIDALHPGRPPTVLVTDYWNVFVMVRSDTRLSTSATWPGAKR